MFFSNKSNPRNIAETGLGPANKNFRPEQPGPVHFDKVEIRTLLETVCKNEKLTRNFQNENLLMYFES